MDISKQEYNQLIQAHARPSPLVRAYCLEEKLQTPAKIYYKFEGNNTSGSHKLNSAIAQAYYAKKQGLVGVTTETEAGMLNIRAKNGVILCCGGFPASGDGNRDRCASRGALHQRFSCTR